MGEMLHHTHSDEALLRCAHRLYEQCVERGTPQMQYKLVYNRSSGYGFYTMWKSQRDAPCNLRRYSQ